MKGIPALVSMLDNPNKEVRLSVPHRPSSIQFFSSVVFKVFFSSAEIAQIFPQRDLKST